MLTTYFFSNIKISFLLLITFISINLSAQTDEETLDIYLNAGKHHKKESILTALAVQSELTDIGLKQFNLGVSGQLDKHAVYAGYGIGWDYPIFKTLNLNSGFETENYSMFEFGYQYFTYWFFDQKYYDIPFSGLFFELSNRYYFQKNVLDNYYNLFQYGIDKREQETTVRTISLGFGSGFPTSFILGFLPERLLLKPSLHLEYMWGSENIKLFEESNGLRGQIKFQLSYLII